MEVCLRESQGPQIDLWTFGWLPYPRMTHFFYTYNWWIFFYFFFLILSDISPQLSLFGRKYEGTALPWTVQSSTECIQWPHNVTACSAEVAILNLCEYIPEIHRRTRSTFLYYIFSVKGGDGGLSIAKWTVFETNVAGDWTAGLVFAKHSTLELYPHPKSVTSFIN